MSSIQVKDLAVGYDHQPAACPGSFTISNGDQL